MSGEIRRYELPDNPNIYKAKAIEFAIVESPDEDRVMLRFSSPQYQDLVFVEFPSFDDLYCEVDKMHRKLRQRMQGDHPNSPL